MVLKVQVSVSHSVEHLLSFIDLEAFGCSEKAEGCKNVSIGGKGNSRCGHSTYELHKKISLMLAQP